MLLTLAPIQIHDMKQEELSLKKKESKKTSYFSILSSLILATIKWLAGIFGNSYALIADAIESTADVFSSVLVLIGNKYSYKPADDDHPYGHGRMEAVVTFVVVGFLIASAIVIVIQSIQNILTPHDLPRSFTLYIIAGIILWKELSYQYVVRKANKIGSTSLKADAWHHRSDAITSVAAFIGISVALILGEGYESADDWAALFAAGCIFYNSYLILKPALGEVMDKDMHNDLEQQIREESMCVCGVCAIDKCHIRKSGIFYHVDIHVIVDRNMTVQQGHAIGHAVKEELINKFPSIVDVMTHVEPSAQ